MQATATSPLGAGARTGGRRRLERPDEPADVQRPVSNDAVAITFSQAVGANEALRTGSYSKTLTFTLSTTTP